MESLEALDHLYDDFPDVLFLHELLIVLAFADALKDISIVSKFHHNTLKQKAKFKRGLGLNKKRRFINLIGKIKILEGDGV